MDIIYKNDVSQGIILLSPVAHFNTPLTHQWDQPRNIMTIKWCCNWPSQIFIFITEITLLLGGIIFSSHFYFYTKKMRRIHTYSVWLCHRGIMWRKVLKKSILGGRLSTDLMKTGWVNVFCESFKPSHILKVFLQSWEIS